MDTNRNGGEAAQAAMGLTRALMGIARQIGRCTSCGYVICNCAFYRLTTTIPRACPLSDAPLFDNAASPALD